MNSTSAITLVAIDDDPATLDLVRAALKQEPVEVLTAGTAEEGMALVERRRPQVVLMDLRLPQVSGMELLERVVAASPVTDVILITAHYSTDSAVEAIRKGASDYLTKPISVAALRERITRYIEDAQRREAALRADQESVRAYQFEGMVGRSPMLLEVFARIRRVAPHFQTALVTGATGTGKELVAQALHRLSPGSAARLAVCNCSAVVESLFESELFGHVKGAFTGASHDKVGLFEYASGGTAFLDEIGDMPLDTQSKLLRVLESREIQRVGSPAVRGVDVRVVAATNRDLRDLMERKLFRDDLYYRLSMVEIRLPSLADRREDLPLLERHFIEYFAALYGKKTRGLTTRAQALLARYAWPGNVRELRSVIGSACMLAEGDLIDVTDLPEYLGRGSQKALEEQDFGLLPLDEVYRRHIRRVLEKVNGNKKRAAKILGIHRATLHRYLSEEDDTARATHA